MTITKKQLKQLHKAAKPLVKWVTKNGNPYTFVTVTQDVVRFLEVIASSPTKFKHPGRRGTRKVSPKEVKKRRKELKKRSTKLSAKKLAAQVKGIVESSAEGSILIGR